jgi:uncharacterized protein YggE
MYLQQALPSPPPETNVLKVSGEGMVSATPDRALVTLGSITTGQTVNAAQNENAANVSKIINSLLQLGIEKEKIQTVTYRIDTEYDYIEGKQVFRGYRVTHLLQVTVDQINRTGTVIDTAVANGANSVTNIEFTVRKSEAYYNQALLLAIQNAEGKAQTMATRLRVTLNKIPKLVQEISESREPIVPLTVGFAAKSEGTPIQPGQLQIKALIQVEYSYF